MPLTDERSTSTGGTFQSFVNLRTGRTTKILWSGSTGAHPVVESSGIGVQWARRGYESTTGYLTSAEVTTPTGAYQRFRNVRTGVLTQYTLSRSTGAVTVATVR
ncbi:LGFP repeat-containing protein [Kocuria tytonicola]|uniref:LGFP repeat-containing protein n=1 Tax=Kocuria tytonicola TaxID=2055946 RepID=UPI001FB53B3E|nr:hypothetical protein [Kocuria tytonicola]